MGKDPLLGPFVSTGHKMMIGLVVVIWMCYISVIGSANFGKMRSTGQRHNISHF